MLVHQRVTPLLPRVHHQIALFGSEMIHDFEDLLAQKLGN